LQIIQDPRLLIAAGDGHRFLPPYQSDPAIDRLFELRQSGRREKGQFMQKFLYIGAIEHQVLQIFRDVGSGKFIGCFGHGKAPFWLVFGNRP
jgi:hypothetical protein